MKTVARIIIGIIVMLALAMLMKTAWADTDAVCVVHKGEWVWVRDTPSKDGTQIEKIRWGYEVKISQISNQYAYITWADGKTGWVDVSYLEIPIQETIYVVTSDGPLNKRETPEGRYSGRIKSGARVSVLGWRYSKSGELWAKVYKGGYVNAKYLAEAN